MGCVPFLTGFQSTRLLGDPGIGRHLTKQLGHGDGAGGTEQDTECSKNHCWAGVGPCIGRRLNKRIRRELILSSEQCWANVRDAHSKAEQLSSPSSHLPSFGFAQDLELRHKNAGILSKVSLIEFPAC